MSELKNGCSKVHPLLEAYFEGALSEAEERMVAEHLWQCPRCAAELQQVQRMTLALDSLPQIEPARELLASITARLATLPSPAERRISVGWRRFGLVAAAALALVALASFGVSLLAPALLREAHPVIVFFGHTVHAFGAWASACYRSLLELGESALTLWPVARTMGLAAMPRVIAYGAAEIALLLVATWAIRTRHRRVLVPSQVGTRRS
jgi:predicted anti-sigma-YlaC factor YlaD